MSRAILLQYVSKESPIHRLDPVTKIVYVFSLSLITLFIFEPVTGLLVLIFSVLVYRAAKLEIKVLRNLFISFIPAMLMIMFVWSYTTAKTADATFVWRYGWIGLTDTALIVGSAVITRILSVISITTMLLATTTQRDIIEGFRKLRLPYIMCFIMALALRTIMVFLEDYSRIKEAQMARALEYEKGPVWEKLVKVRFIVIPLLASALNRAITITSAVESRGLTVGGKRTFYHTTKMRRFEYPIVLGLIGLVIFVALTSMLFGYYTKDWFYDTWVPLVRVAVGYLAQMPR